MLCKHRKGGALLKRQAKMTTPANPLISQEPLLIPDLG
jgi:hypothetical protein